MDNGTEMASLCHNTRENPDVIKFKGGFLIEPGWEHQAIPDPGLPGPVTYYYILEGKVYMPTVDGEDVRPAPDWMEYVDLRLNT